MAIPGSNEWLQIFINAREIAGQLEQNLSSVHVVLAIFLIPNKAEELLLERGVNEDRILEQLEVTLDEPPYVLEELSSRSQLAAANCNASEIDSLHLLIAISRVRSSLAYKLLAKCGVLLPELRNKAMAYSTGRVKRRFSTAENTHLSVLTESPPYPSRSGDTDTLSGDTLSGEAPLMPGELDPQVYPRLHQMGRNLTALALAGEFDPLIGRERELEEAIDILGKRRANNPCLVGEPGVGKTALVEGLAAMLAHQKVPGLSEKIIVQIDMGGLLAGTQLRGALEEKLKGIKDEVRAANGQVIVFIDEIHTLVRAGAVAEGAQDVSNELKTALSRGEFPCIDATTIQDFKNFIEPEPALARRFHMIQVEEPSLLEARRIVEGVVPQYAIHHNVRYDEDAIVAAIQLSERFLHDRRLPAKAIDLIDLAGSKAKNANKKSVTFEEVARALASQASVPEEHLFVEERERLLSMEVSLGQSIIGHEEQIKQIATVVRRNYAGFNGKRSLGSFLFLGPPGVGKTALAKALAVFLFGGQRSITRIDMSEYKDSASVNRLIGAPPGYVGHDDGGFLTEKIRSNPYQLVLIDEVEKAHRDVQMLLLQLLDEGILTDGKGRSVSFSKCVVIMTSNLGSEEITRRTRGKIGFSRSDTSQEEVRAQILDSASKQFPPELWNRIDEQLVFAPLSHHELCEIARLLVDQSSSRLESQAEIRYCASDQVIDWLIQQGGYNPRYGVRPMRAIVERHLEASLADKILRGVIAKGTQWRAVLSDDGFMDWEIWGNPNPNVDSAPPANEQSGAVASHPSSRGRSEESEEKNDDDEPIDPIAFPL